MTHPSDEDWAQRVLDERDQLASRLFKLTKFLETPAAMQVAHADRVLLRQQQGYMALYLATLEQRIAAFPQ